MSERQQAEILLKNIPEGGMAARENRETASAAYPALPRLFFSFMPEMRAMAIIIGKKESNDISPPDTPILFPAEKAGIIRNIIAIIR